MSFQVLILEFRTVELREKVDILDEALDDLDCDLEPCTGGGSVTEIMTEFRSMMGLGLLRIWSQKSFEPSFSTKLQPLHLYRRPLPPGKLYIGLYTVTRSIASRKSNAISHLLFLRFRDYFDADISCVSRLGSLIDE